MDWRTYVFEGKLDYDEAIEKHIEDFLKLVADSTGSFISNLDNAGSSAVYARRVETLRPRIAEIRRMLTPDDAFFEGEELDALSAHAIDEDEKGLTADFRVMGE